MKGKLLLMIPVLFISSAVLADDLKSVKRQFVELQTEESSEWREANASLTKETYVADEIIRQLYKRYPVDSKEIERWIATQQPDGSWTDIDYDTMLKPGTDLQLMQHIERIHTLVRLYNKVGQVWQDNSQVKQCISRAMDWWFQHRPVVMEATKRRGPKVNWWWNEIGIPKSLGATFVMFENQMSEQQRRQAIEVMKISKIGTTGQNKVWLAGNVLVRGLLENNMETVRMARDTIVSTIVYGSHGERGEGIMHDWSFQQHGQQQQFGNYGAAFLADMGMWSSVWQGTDLAMPQEKLDIIARLISEGFGRVYWKGRLDINGIGRQFFHQAQRHKGLSLWLAAEQLAKVDAKNRPLYEALIESNFTKAERTNPIHTGLYYFFNSLQTVMRQPSWMASQRMSSKRALGGEAGNGDNKRGWYMSDGSLYTYVDGSEYDNIFALWDWRKLPGVTAYDSQEPLKQLSFVGYYSLSQYAGHVGNGRIGMTVQNLVRDGITAYKAWVFTPGYILSFGNIVEATQEHPVTTSIDQPWKRGELTLLEGKKWTPIDSLTVKQPEEVRLHHNRVGYIVLQADELTATARERTGCWFDVMGTYPSTSHEKGEVVTLWMNHGKHPQGNSYAFLTLPDATQKEVSKFRVDDIRILASTSHAQAVYLVKENTVFASLPQAGSITLPDGKKFTAHTAGLYMIQLGKQPTVTFYDPINQINNTDYEFE